MKSAKSTYLCAIASYMLAQLCVLLVAFWFGGSFHSDMMQSYGMFHHDYVLSYRGGMDVGPILLFWIVGTALFALIFALFHFPGSWRTPFAPRREPGEGPAAEPAAAADEASGAAAGAAADAEPAAAKVETPRAYIVGSDDGTGLGIAALISGVVGFVPGFGLVFSIVGLICGLIGSMRAGAAGNAAGRSLSLIGIVLSALSLALTVVTVVLLGSAIGMMMSLF